MRVGVRQFFCLVVLVAITVIYLNGTRILMPGDRNWSYLSDLGYRDRSNGWNEFFFGRTGAWGNYSAYQTLANDYEMKRNYGLLDANEEADYRRQFGRMAQDAFQNWQRYRANSLVRSTADKVDRRYDIRAWARENSAMVALGVAAAVYTGRTLRYRMGSDLSFESRTSMQGSKMEGQYLGWQSAGLDASVGAQIDPGGQSGFAFQKRLSSEISLNYQMQAQHSVGLTYSRGF